MTTFKKTVYKKIKLRRVFKNIAFIIFVTCLGLALYFSLANGTIVQAYKYSIKVINSVDVDFYKQILQDKIYTIDMTYDNGSNIDTQTSNYKALLKSRLNFLDIAESGIYTIPNNSTATQAPGNPQTTQPPIPNIHVPITSTSLVTNLAKLKFDQNGMLSSNIKFNYSKKNGKIIIYHTHSHEYYSDNKRFGVVRTANVLSKLLEDEYKFKVIHNATENDVNYNFSYWKGAKTLTSILSGNPKNLFILDVHRDATSSSKPLRVTTTYKDKSYAQIMFVVGSDVREKNANWHRNLQLALQLQRELNKLCPGIARPIYFTPKRYNQNLGKRNIIAEIGGDGNSQAEANRSAEVLAKAINNLFK